MCARVTGAYGQGGVPEEEGADRAGQRRQGLRWDRRSEQELVGGHERRGYP